MPGFTPVKMMTIVFDNPPNPNAQGDIKNVTIWDVDGNPHSPPKKPCGTHNKGAGRTTKKSYGELKVEEGTTCIIIGGIEWCF